MTKSRKRREAEERKAAAIQAAQPAVKAQYALVDLKPVGKFLAVKKPKDSPSIARGLTAWPAQHTQAKPAKVQKFAIEIEFPCAMAKLLNLLTGNETKVTYSKFSKDHDPKFTIHAPFGHKRSMSRVEFARIAVERFGIPDLDQYLMQTAECVT